MDLLRKQILSWLLFLQFLVISAETNPGDLGALTSLMSDLKNTPPNWVGADPCGGWEGIACINSRVNSITLASVGITGRLSGDIELLSELQILDLSYNKGLSGTLPPSIGRLTKLTNLLMVGCDFFGVIPDSIGSLQQLMYLSLNSNRFNGRIPASIGKLSNLVWLDLADNQLEGSIPVSSGTTPGLDMLTHAKHFHFGKNKLSGPIPPKLFQPNMSLIHVLVDNNTLNGTIPSTLSLVTTLEVVRLDRNFLTGPVPSNLSRLSKLGDLFLANNRLNGSIPDLTGMNQLTYVDLSNNTFNVSDIPPWFSTLQSLTTLVMESTWIQGELPSALFSLPNLQSVVLSKNRISGTLTIKGFSNQLQLVDLRNNMIIDVESGTYSSALILVDNPICQEVGATTAHSFCTIPPTNFTRYSTPSNNCLPTPCSSNQISSPSCICAYPFTGILHFRAPSFSGLGTPSYYASLETSLMQSFQSNNLPVNSISLSNPFKDSSDYLEVYLAVFPSGQDHFNRTGLSQIGFVLSNQTFKPPDFFGPFFFLADPYTNYGGATESKKTSTGVIIGAVVGGSVLLILLVLAGIYAFHQKRRAERATELQNPFSQWDSTMNSGGVPQLKGARFFSFEELKKSSNNFSEANEIGSGGYGKVYKGTLLTGELVAIKRAQNESMQGGVEFKNEIELLSRVHHKNLVGLVGFCFEQGEQMLVYEYIPNGNLKDTLSGKTGIRLDWMRRLKITVGAARGLLYLHELANPPIIHRDIKSNNILLDERLTAKVADFGLSKLMVDDDKDHVTTQVKGTLGYLDPEYYMTQQLTEKSDVYSFGVLMLELITARKPIERGKYIVREVRMAMDKTKNLYNLYEILDPVMTSETLKGLERYVDLAMRCLEETGAKRPTMNEVVKELESIMVLAGLNPNAESAATSATYEDVSKGSAHPYGDDEFSNTVAFPVSKLEPQ